MRRASRQTKLTFCAEKLDKGKLRLDMIRYEAMGRIEYIEARAIRKLNKIKV